MKLFSSAFLSSLLLVGLTTSCTITRVDSREGPPRIVSRGLVEGHAAFGVLDEDHLLHVDLFDGSSDGAIFELGLWKLLRLEIGLAGASASVGPLHLGLGVLFYEPEVPRMMPTEGAAAAGEADGSEANGCFIEELEECDRDSCESEKCPADSTFEVDPQSVTDE